MKILHICSVTSRPNGIKTVLKKLAAKQRELGCQVEVVSLCAGESDFECVDTIPKFYKKIKSDRPNIVIFHSVYFWLYIPFAIILWLYKIPYAIELHGALSIENFKVSHKKKVIANAIAFNWFIKRAGAIIYLNKNEYDNSVVKSINPNYTIIPNGCDLMDHLADKDVVPTSKLKIVYMGRINKIHKGLDVMLDAMEILCKRGAQNKVHFIICGDGIPQEQAWFLEQLPRVKSIVEYKGAIYGKKKDDIMRDSDVFILTSRFEGMPMGVLEALSLGMPCILTRETNLGQEVYDAGAGWLTFLDAQQISDTILRVVDEYPKQYAKMRECAYKLSKKYDWMVVANESIESYSRIISNYA